MTSRLLTLTALVLSSLCLLAADQIDEKQFQKYMKEVGDTGKRFKAGMDSKNAAQVSKDAARLAEIHKELIGFWKGRKVDDAAKWAEETSKAAASLATAAKAEDWDKAKAELGNYMKSCKSCHDAYREKLDDGSSRIRVKK